MRHDTLTRAAFAALLTAALWLPASHAQALDSADERALAAQAYERLKPMLREMAKKSYAQGLASGKASEFADCEAAATQLRADLERDTTPVVLELFFSDEMRRRMEDILVDVYDAEQLRATAAHGNAPTRPEQSAQLARAFQELGVDFQQRVAQDSRIVAALVKALQNVTAQVQQCRAEQRG